jgi:ABC-2 type transport system ATP-binding protein
MTILLTTHYLDEAERLCDRIAIMHAGRIVALDTPARLRDDLGRQLLEVRVADDPELALASLQALGIAGADAFSVGATLTVPLRDREPRDALDAIADAGIATSAISTRSPTLDDVYLRLTGTRLAA